MIIGPLVASTINLIWIQQGVIQMCHVSFFIFGVLSLLLVTLSILLDEDFINDVKQRELIRGNGPAKRRLSTITCNRSHKNKDYTTYGPQHLQHRHPDAL